MAARTSKQASGTEYCKHGSSAPVALLQSLPISQARTARHKCTVCSYQKGFEDAHWGSPLLVPMEDCGHGKIAPIIVLEDLPESQAGTGRHKCATCAYQFGFEAGLNEQATFARLFSGRIHGRGRGETPQPETSVLTLVEPPEFETSNEAPPTTFRARKNLERSFKEHRNLQLGRAGELLVLGYERTSLLANGKPELARKIIHTSEVEGDGAGYDIKSFEPDGRTKFIEVKTTRGPSTMPFFITYNEVKFSKAHSEQYHLFRVFDFNLASSSGRCYVINGRVDKCFNLSATVFRASRQ